MSTKTGRQEGGQTDVRGSLQALLAKKECTNHNILLLVGHTHSLTATLLAHLVLPLVAPVDERGESPAPEASVGDLRPFVLHPCPVLCCAS